MGNRAVEGARERRRSRRADFILHGHDGRQAALHQCRAQPGKEARLTAACTFAGVEHDEPQGWVILEQRAQRRRRDGRRLPGFIRQHECAATRALIVERMAHIVEDVPGPLLQRRLERLPRRNLQPHQLHVVALLQRVHGQLQADALACHIHGRPVGGSGHHSQNAQRRFHGERLGGCAQWQVPHEGRGAREGQELVAAGVKEQFPGKRSQRRVLEAQAHAQPGMLGGGQLLAHIQAIADLALEERLEEQATQRARLLHRGGGGGRYLCQRVCIECAVGFTRGRAQNLNGAQAVVAGRLNLNLKLKIGGMWGGPLFHAVSARQAGSSAVPLIQQRQEGWVRGCGDCARVGRVCQTTRPHPAYALAHKSQVRTTRRRKGAEETQRKATTRTENSVVASLCVPLRLCAFASYLSLRRI